MTMEMEDGNTTVGNLYHDILLDEDPGWKYSEALFMDFATLMSEGGSAEELAGRFLELSLGQCDIMTTLLARLSDPERTQRTMEVRQQMLGERGFWRLFASVLRLRYGETPTPTRLSQYSSDADVHAFLSASDHEYRILTTLAEWCSSNSLDQLSMDFGAVEERAHIWEDALHDLRSAKPNPPLKAFTLDAKPSHLSGPDAAAERGMWQTVLMHIRCGETEKVGAVCRRVGMQHLAAVVAALHLPSANDASRRQTKAMAWKAATLPQLSAVERGVLGILSGNVKAVLPLCTRWEDALFAHASAAATQRLDAYIDRLRHETPLIADAEEVGVSDVFRRLAASPSAALSEEARNPVAALVQALATAEPDRPLPDSLLPFLHDFLASLEDDVGMPRHLLRLFAHAVLLLQRLPDYRGHEDAANAVIELYVTHLVEDGRDDVIAFYTARLSRDDLQIKNYAVYTETLLETKDRRAALERAEEEGLDVRGICVATVERVSEEALVRDSGSSPTSAQMSLPASSAVDVPASDVRLTRALEWLTFNPFSRLDALEQSNLMIRGFLLGGRSSSAAAAMDMIPADSFALISATNADNLEPRDEATLHTHYALRKFLEAEGCFAEWFETFHKGPEKAPEGSLNVTSSDPLVTHARSARREKQTQEAKENWEHRCMVFAAEAVKALMLILEFPGHGWLLHNLSLEDKDNAWSSLRSLCVRRCVDALLHVYRETRDEAAVWRLAVVLAEESRGLYKVVGPVMQKIITSVSGPSERK